MENGINKEYSKEYLEKLEEEIDYKIFNDNLLLNKTTKEKFKFTNQKEYEKVSLYVIEYVKYLMLEKYDLQTLWLPTKKRILKNSRNFPKSEITPQCEIYISKDFYENTNKLLCLVQGTGNVRAGIWARSVCINDSLDLGSVLPFVKKGIKEGMSVIIFNPNERVDSIIDKPIKEFNTMQNHCLWVYQNIVKRFSPAKEIYFVSHSMGGMCTVDILKNNKEDLTNGKIKKIAFTDSVYTRTSQILDKESHRIFNKISVNYVTSNLKAGEFIREANENFTHILSAGHIKHEYTSGTAFEEVFEFFNNEDYLVNKIIENKNK